MRGFHMKKLRNQNSTSTPERQPPARINKAGDKFDLTSSRCWIVVFISLGLSLILNLNNLNNDLVYDDHEAITKNEAAHGLENTGLIFTTPSWWSASVTYVRHYRPVTTWTYALNYSLHGLDPLGYHLFNNILHGLVSGLVYLVLLASGLGLGPSLMAAALFLVHPIHAEAVAWVNCRADILAGGFILLSLLFHIRAQDHEGIRKRLFALGGIFSLILAGLSKETGFMTPFVLLAWDLAVRDGADARKTWSILRTRGWKEYLPHIIILIVFVWSRAQFVGGAAEATVSKMASPLGEAGFIERLFTGSYVIARYIWLLLFPLKLSVDYSPNQITLVESLGDPRALLGLGVLMVYGVVVLLTLRRSRHISFSLLAAAIILTPGANILFPVGTIMAERLLYLPVLAVCVPLAVGLWAFHLRAKRSWITLGLLVMLLALYGSKTVLRNRDWQNEETLFRSALAVSPKSAMAHKNLASVLHEKGLYDDAIPLAERAVEIVPEFPDAHLVLGNCYFMKGRYADAETAYRTTLSLVPKHASAHLNLGAAYHVTGHFPEALAMFNRAIALDPRLDLAWFNRVHTLVALGRVDEAEMALDEAMRRFPNHPAEREARGKMGRAKKAEMKREELSPQSHGEHREQS
jgi:tetratricopeptide (TPR) repeat protein